MPLSNSGSFTFRTITGSALSYEQLDNNFFHVSKSYAFLSSSNEFSGSIGIAGSQTEDPLWLSRSSGYDLMVASSGNIGIGTSTPSQLLELKKTSASVIALLNYNDSVKFNINASSGGAGYVGMVSNHPLIFVNNDTERVRIDTSGNVGIGTSSPIAKLEPYGTGWTSNAVGSGLLRLNGTDNYPTITFAQSSTPKWSIYVGGVGSWVGNGNIGIVS